MAKPDYFKYFPNIEYPVKLLKSGKTESITIKDYFHLLLPRDDIFKEETLYEQYFVKNGQRPDQISYNLYGDEQYYWVILQINEITDYYSQWPLSQYELDEYILKKYGSDSAADEVRHYETQKVVDREGDQLLPSGLKVSKDYKFTYKEDSGVLKIVDSVPVTNRKYEYTLNEEKSEIFVLQSKFVGQYKREIKQFNSKFDSNIVGNLSISDLN